MDNKLKEANEILTTNYKDWVDLSQYQKLSENFIEKFKDKVDWFLISIYQKLSEDFIERF